MIKNVFFNVIEIDFYLDVNLRFKIFFVFKYFWSCIGGIVIEGS